MQIKIGYKNYELRYKDCIYTDKPEELYGQIDYCGKTIDLSRKFDREQQECTLLHEIIHGADDDRGLKLSEHQVDQLAVGLYQVFRDNPGMVGLTELDAKQKVLLAIYAEHQKSHNRCFVTHESLGMDKKVYMIAVNKLQIEGLITGAQLHFTRNSPYPEQCDSAPIKISEEGIKLAEEIAGRQ